MTIVMRACAMDEDENSLSEDRNLVFLRRLVTVLTGTMIVGVLTIVVLLVIRLQAPPAPRLPETIALPDGMTAEAVTFGQGWVGIVTTDGEFLILDQDTGAITDRVAITRPE